LRNKTAAKVLLLAGLLLGCIHVRAQVREAAEADLIDLPQLQGAQVGICILDLSSNRILYQYQDNKYFTPASNTKIVTLYTGLSILGDSTTGIKYGMSGDTLYFQGTGDPSFLHPDYSQQPVFDFLRSINSRVLVFSRPVYENKVYGPGWAWDDYDADYQPERSSLPLYGNVVWFTVANHYPVSKPDFFQKRDSIVSDTGLRTHSIDVSRAQYGDIFSYHIVTDQDTIGVQVPFMLFGEHNTVALLQDTLHRAVIFDTSSVGRILPNSIKNIPVDSLYSHMMWRSDNFFAEQVLQMCSSKMFDTISSQKIIHYMLENKLADLPDKPAWVDGSGLSRYDLFTPEDLVAILGKLYGEFPKERLFRLFPTGGEGTLEHLYQPLAGYIYAKTGSLNNNAALSGYLITKNGNTLIFSVLVGNYIMSGSLLRSQIEKFLSFLWDNN
jgi:D-alanyl-D-alanine carboxypeptidase/D-alanyl-D-alanine-endopeptidase (penicillin-binding protein 4)